MPSISGIAAAERVAAVALARKHGDDVAAEVYGVDRSTIRKWRSDRRLGRRWANDERPAGKAHRSEPCRPVTVAWLRSQGWTDDAIRERFSLSDAEWSAILAALAPRPKLAPSKSRPTTRTIRKAS